MAALIKPSIFESGADDALTVVDVYNGANVLDLSGLGIELPSLPSLGFDFSTATLDDYLALGGTLLAGITLSQLLKGKLNDGQLRRLIPTLSRDILPRAMLKWLSAYTLGDVNSAMSNYINYPGSINLESLSATDFTRLMTIVVAAWVWDVSLTGGNGIGGAGSVTSTAVGARVVTGEYSGAGAIATAIFSLSGTTAVRTPDAANALVQAALSPQIDYTTDDYSNRVTVFSDYANVNAAAISLYEAFLTADNPVTYASDYIISSVIRELVDMGVLQTPVALTALLEVPLSPVERKRTIIQMLGRFQPTPGMDPTENAKVFLDDLYTIDPMWDKFIRNGVVEQDFTMWKWSYYAARSILFLDPRTRSAAGTIMFSSVSANRPTQVMTNTYPRVYFK